MTEMRTLQRVAMKLDGGASFEDESVLGNSGRNEEHRCTHNTKSGKPQPKPIKA